MEMKEIQVHIENLMIKMRGKKKLKEQDVIKKIVADHEGLDKVSVKESLRDMINNGRLMYSYGGGASSVEIPSMEYLIEKFSDEFPK